MGACQPSLAVRYLLPPVDLLMGPEGRLRQALLTDTAHWGVRNFDIDRE